MRCPFCKADDLKVTDSRNSDANAVRRRRECLRCLKRFTTFETVVPVIQVKKRDGRYEDFDLDKIVRGLNAACCHTRISKEGVRKLASEIAQELMDKESREIATIGIGELVMRKLKSLDTIAYIRFACVYRRFKDKDELINAINS